MQNLAKEIKSLQLTKALRGGINTNPKLKIETLPISYTTI